MHIVGLPVTFICSRNIIIYIGMIAISSETLLSMHSYAYGINALVQDILCFYVRR